MTIERVIADLRERRLWPVALVLLAAIVVVPFVLAKTPAPVPAPPAPPTAAAAAVRTVLPSVSVSTTPPRSQLNAKPRNPFIPPTPPKAVTTITTAPATAAPASSVASSSGGATTRSASSSPATTGYRATTPSQSSPGTRIPPGRTKPAPSGLTDRQSYAVTLAATNRDGGLSTAVGLERLSPVPSAAKALLVELGVLEGGQRVLFAVLPGTRISGPGACTPGPIDCEVLTLGVNQIETVAAHDPGSPSTEFAVTAVTVADHHSVRAAQQARGAVDRQGRTLLSGAGLDATISLFPYERSLGALVDQRTLSAGAS